MIGLDTNVLVRYLVQDDPAQAARASALVESLTPAKPGFVSLVVLVETVWVLESRYDADHAQVGRVLETLLRTGGLVIEQAELAWQAVRQCQQSRADFADALVGVLARRAGCDTVYTFDRAAAKRAGMTLLA